MDVADELLMADMDARLIIQVVVNLVNNALSYSPPEGRVVVTARAAHEGDAACVRVAVTDEGPGLSEEDRRHIFDLFYNGSTGRPSGKSGDFKRGMGLGLPLSRSIVEVHGGRLDVRNVTPHGCEFSFVLPAVDAAKRHGGGAAGRRPAAGEGGRAAAAARGGVVRRGPASGGAGGSAAAARGGR